jgi:predicted MFS family arabinose efflux permease
MLFAALAPLLPKLVDDLRLSVWGAGILTAAYPAGLVLATLPAGIAAARWGPRPTAIAGMWTIALSGVGFALGTSAIVVDASRFMQGAGAAAAWAGALAWVIRETSPARRGSVLGATIGAAFVGTVIAPVVAFLASAGDRSAVFLSVAVVLAGVAAWGGPRTARAHRPARRRGGLVALVRLRNPSAARGLMLMALVGILLGVLQSRGPLLLSARGLDNAAIAAVFLAAYAPQVVVTPLVGRGVDRWGTAVPIALCMGLLALALPAVPAVPGAIAPALLVAALTSSALAAWSPVAVLVSGHAQAAGNDQGLAMAYVNGAYALGAALGALVASQLARTIGDQAVFGAAAALCAAAVVSLLRGRRRASASTTARLRRDVESRGRGLSNG